MTHVRRVEDGWLGGADDGLWFTADDGRNWERLVLQEITALTTLGDDIVAITQHPTWAGWDPDHGIVFAVRRGADGWKTVALVNLFSTPSRYLREPDGALLVLAAQGLARVQPGGMAQWVAAAENAGLYPCSMVRDGQGVIYVGTRGAVLRFIPVGQLYYADWLVPED